MTKRVIAIILLMLSFSAVANDLAGKDEPEFQAALQLWLNDNDDESLTRLSKLAMEGNVAARLLLARIEVTDRAPSEFVTQLTRKEYMDIFRS